MYYSEFLSELYRNSIEYLIVGGLAVNLHGVPRVTHDIDIIVSTKNGNIKKLVEVFQKLNYSPRLPLDPIEMVKPESVKDWIENRNLIAFSFYHKKHNYQIVDVLLDYPLNFEESYKNKVIKKAGDIEIFLLSLDDLIKMKNHSGREQDISDIQLLEKVRQWKKE